MPRQSVAKRKTPPKPKSIQLLPPFSHSNDVPLVRPKIEEDLWGKQVECEEGTLTINLVGDICATNEKTNSTVAYIPKQ